MCSVNIYSENTKNLENFLSSFYNCYFDLNSKMSWNKKYPNPIEMADIIGAFIDNYNKYNLIMWISLDKGIYIDIKPDNANLVIRYLFERFPY